MSSVIYVGQQWVRPFFIPLDVVRRCVTPMFVYSHLVGMVVFVGKDLG